MRLQFWPNNPLKDLPSDNIIIGCIKEEVKLNGTGVKPEKAKRPEKKKLILPGYVIDALRKNKKALSTFENISLSNKKDYVGWIKEAKTEESRNKRSNQPIEWMAEGKIRNWKCIR